MTPVHNCEVLPTGGRRWNGQSACSACRAGRRSGRWTGSLGWWGSSCWWWDQVVDGEVIVTTIKMFTDRWGSTWGGSCWVRCNSWSPLPQPERFDSQNWALEISDSSTCVLIVGSNNWYVDAPRQFQPSEWYHDLWTDPTPPEGWSQKIYFRSINKGANNFGQRSPVYDGDFRLMNTSMMTPFMLSWRFSTGWRLWFTSVMSTSKMVMAWSWKPSSRWAWAEIKRAEGRSPPLKDKKYSTTFSPE